MTSITATHKPPTLSIVIPVYRGAASLPELVTELEQTLQPRGAAYEIIAVDDGSPDDSWPVIVGLQAMHPHLRGIRLMRNYGQHNALLCGILAAQHELIVTMDDDLQHDPGSHRHIAGCADRRCGHGVRQPDAGDGTACSAIWHRR